MKHKYIKHIINICRHIFFLLLALSVLTCERDDICPEDVPTTPRMIIEFFDISDQEVVKDVPNLRVQGIGNLLPLSNFIGNSAESLVELPLKTNENSTQFSFIKDYAIDDNGTPDDDSDDVVTGNEDIITINYAPETEYVSRACGFKTIYKAVSIEFDASDTDRWILLTESVVNNQLIEDESTTHFKFYHQ